MASKEPGNRQKQPQGRDRLTWLLVGVAVVLTAAVVFLAIGPGQATDGQETPTPSATPSLQAAVPTEPTPTLPPITPPPCVVPQDWVAHKVQEGNTLYSLAQRYGSDVDTLMGVNCLQSDLIYIGQELYVPPPPSLQASVPELITGSQPLPAGSIQVDFPERFLNIILLGSDRREGSATWRTDTMIVVSIDAERNLVRLLSIPRDLWVDIPGHGYDRINTADLWGELVQEGSGPELVKETVYQNLDIPIHYYVRVDFEGFKKIIDAVGGIDVDVTCPLTDIGLLPGMHHMDGEMALNYARSRITTNDFDRSRRQRKILMALWQQKLNRDLIPRLPALWVALSGAVETDLPLDRVIGLASLGLQLRPNQIFSQSIGPWHVQDWFSPQGANVLLPLKEEIQTLIDSFYGPIDFAFLERIGQTRVQVLNGTGRDQMDQLVATSLSWRGFQIAGTGRADGGYSPQTQILVFNASEDVAELLAQTLDLMPETIIYQPDPASPVDIQVILGADYDPCAPR